MFIDLFVLLDKTDKFPYSSNKKVYPLYLTCFGRYYINFMSFISEYECSMLYLGRLYFTRVNNSDWDSAINNHVGWRISERNVSSRRFLRVFFYLKNIFASYSVFSCIAFTQDPEQRSVRHTDICSVRVSNSRHIT